MVLFEEGRGREGREVNKENNYRIW